MPIAVGGMLVNEEWRFGGRKSLGEIALRTFRYSDIVFGQGFSIYAACLKSNLQYNIAAMFDFRRVRSGNFAIFRRRYCQSPGHGGVLAPVASWGNLTIRPDMQCARVWCGAHFWLRLRKCSSETCSPPNVGARL